VTITYAREDDTKREVLPSVFIGELRTDLIEEIKTDEHEEKYKSDPGFSFQPAQATDTHSIKDQAFVHDLFTKQGLSVSALNNYLECPWKYFYQNLIRIPQAPTKHQAYGTAVHGALADLFKRLKEEDVSRDYLLASFEGWLNRGSFSPHDFAEAKEKGIKALTGWYDEYHKIFNTNALVEYRINGVALSDDIRLTGVLDKVEFGDGNEVTVVDYKTGKPKSRNELEGKTKSADGNYYRQLTFYKLLLKYFKDGEHAMHAGVIDFIEPDEKGKYHKELFEITDAEVSELEKLILKTGQEILSLSFWDKKCDDRDCEFCTLRNIIAEKGQGKLF
jgi:DNA helicase-2/ATP-dependent DNA helicase PcrA